MPDLEAIYYVLGILGLIGGAFLTFATITISMRKYVDSSVTEMQDSLSEQIEKSAREAREALDKVERISLNRKAAEERMIGEMRVDLSNLKSQVSAHSARFGMLESLLTEVRGDIKTLLRRKEEN